MDESALDELIHQYIAKPLNIHLAAPAEPAEPFLDLRRTRGVDAANVRRVGLALGFLSTFRAFPWRLDGLGIFGALLSDRFDDVRDHFSRALNDDSVSDVQIEPADLIDVVQRDIGDGDTGDEHGFQQPDRS